MSERLDIIGSVEQALPKREPTASVYNAEYIGLAMSDQLDAVAAKLKAIAAGVLTRNDRETLMDEVYALNRLSNRFADGLYQGAIVRAEREKLLVADVKMTFVSVGSVFSQTLQVNEVFVAGVAASKTNMLPNVSAFVTQPQD